jgi:DNA-binding IscR family transcriptional regulator
MNEDALAKPLSEIVEAVDGNGIFYGCGLGLKQCSELNPCPLHNQFKSIREKISLLLHSITIGQFNQELVSGLLSLKK